MMIPKKIRLMAISVYESKYLFENNNDALFFLESGYNMYLYILLCKGIYKSKEVSLRCYFLSLISVQTVFVVFYSLFILYNRLEDIEVLYGFIWYLRISCPYHTFLFIYINIFFGKGAVNIVTDDCDALFKMNYK